MAGPTSGFQGLELVPSEEVKTQVNIFLEHKDEDAEELSHRYDNIRIELEYPFPDKQVVKSKMSAGTATCPKCAALLCINQWFLFIFCM